MKVKTINYSNSPFIGIYQDKIEYADSGKIIYKIGHNDVSDYFGKIIQLELAKSNLTSTNDFNTLFNPSSLDSNSFYDGLKTVIQGNGTDTFFKAIHSWEVGEGNTTWDTVPLDLNGDNTNDVTAYDEYGYPVNGTTPVSSFEFFDAKTANSLYATVNSKSSYRKPVEVSFALPTHYVDSQNSIDTTDSQSIVTNLKNGTYSIDKVVEWQPSISITDFLMVQSIFDTTEQNFQWREFGIFGGNIKNSYVNTPSPDQSTNTEYQKLTSDYGTILDYKVHEVISKTQNMKITRRIIFGFYAISH